MGSAITLATIVKGLLAGKTFRLISDAIPPSRLVRIAGIEVGLIVSIGVSYLHAGRKGADDSCPQ